MRKVWLLVLVFAIAVPSTGCWFHGPGDLKRELSREAGVQLDRQFGVTLGRTSMMLARWGLRMSDETEFSLKGIRRVQVGVYEVEGLRKGVERPGRLDADLFPDWEPIVQIHDEGENVLVLVRTEEERIKGMLVAVTDDDEWVLVRLRGRLDRVVEEAMEMAFDKADRPDLYTASREERGLPPEPPDSSDAIEASEASEATPEGETEVIDETDAASVGV